MNGISTTTLDPQTQVSVLPVSYAQKAIYIMQTVHPDSVSYNIPFAYHFEGAINPVALEQALNSVIARHETFRTAFHLIDDEPKQVVYPELVLSLEVVDCSQQEDPLAFINKAVSRRSASSFCLDQLPLLVSSLYKINDESWVWFLNVHHIVVDHLSILQMATEISQGYQDIIQDKTLGTQPAPLHFGDYAIWQKDNLQGDHLNNLLAKWQDKIDDPSACLALPTVRPRPVHASGKGAELWFSLSPEVSSNVRDFAKSNNASLYMVMLAAYSALLYHYTGEDYIVIGSPFANRGEQPELQTVMGCFTNALPLQLDFSNELNFTQLLQQTKKAVMHGFATQELPFEKLVEELKPHRDSNVNPVFQVAFLLQEPPMEVSLAGASGESLKGKSLKAYSGSAKFDSLIWLWEDSQKISGLIEYSTDLFDEAFITTYISHFEKIISKIVEQPNVDIGQLSLVTDDDRLVINQLNQTSLPVDGKKSLVDAVVDSARRLPEQPAVIDNERTLTYTELNELSDQLACYLINQGVATGDFVGISLDRNVNMLVAMLGILKSGAAYVPLDPDYPLERLAYMVEHSGVRLVVSESAVTSRLDFNSVGSKDASSPTTIVELDKQLETIAEAKATLPTIDPDQPAYVIYTSGSTGKPKGVVAAHRNVINLLESLKLTPGFSEQDRLLAITTLSFDIAVVELYLPLVTGSSVILASRSQSQDPAQLIELIDQHKINFIQATPATWRLLIGHQWPGVQPLTAIVTGEPFPHDLLKPMLALSTSLWDFYGPTETTVYSTCQAIVSVDEPITIGKPIANTECYIVNPHGQLVPPGIAGEMLIGGSGVTHGYLNQAELTDQQFIENPWGEGKLYRTGDRVTLTKQGILHYHERLDQQVKIRGFRIELGEIEARLSEHPEIISCAVVVQGQAPQQRLVAFYERQSNSELALSDLRQHVGDKLPGYMVPEQWFLSEQLPLTPSGKIDRKKLQNTEVTTKVSVAINLKPSTLSERYYAQLWCELLKIDGVSVSDNFFDIGGHSLLSLAFMSRVKKEQGISLSANMLMMNTLGQLAQQFSLKDDDLVNNKAIAQTTVEPQFIGKEYQRLYTVYHPGQSEDPADFAILVCNPFGQEYMRSHRAVRTLVSNLSTQGIASLRFDYQGTGDSAGSVFNIDQAVKDAKRAALYLQQRSGCQKVKVLGIRLGAAIAAYAFAKDPLVTHLSFWDPVVSGSRYLDEVSSTRTSRLQFREDQWWINGFMLDISTRQRISEMNIADIDYANKTMVQLVTDTQLKSNVADLLSTFKDQKIHFSYQETPSYSTNDWGFVDGEGGFIQPNDIIAQLKAGLGDLS